MKELFERWVERDSGKMSVSAVNAHRAAFKHAESLQDVLYKNIKAYQMQEIIDNCGYGHATQAAIKNLFSNLDRYALEPDIITKCYSNLIHIIPTPQSKKKPFSEEEIKAVWAGTG